MRLHKDLLTFVHVGALVVLALVPTACAEGNGTEKTSASSTGSGKGGAGGEGGSIFTGGNGGMGGTPLPYDRWIAFDSDREVFNRDIYVMRPEGTGLKRITTEAATDREPAFANDGKQLAFASDRVAATMQIFIMTLPDLTVKQLTNRPEGADQPAWSADDKTIAFHSGTAVYTIGVDGMGEKKWFDGPDLINAYQHPTFSPDGIWLVVDRGNQITAAKLDGSFQKDIAPNVPNTVAMPTVAPTSALFAFTTYCNEKSIWVAPLSGYMGDACSVTSRLSPMGLSASRPAWGPLGFVAFEGGAQGSADLYIVPEKGGAAVNVTNDPADDRNPAWSPAEGADIPK